MSTATETPVQAASRTLRVEQILNQIEQLPTLPAVATRLLQVTASEASTAADVAAIVESDPALTAKVLGLVRSAAYGLPEVATVERAIVMLGFETVRSAVLSIQVYETFKKAEPDGETPFDRMEFWKHSLAVGCAAKLIAIELRQSKLAGEAFVCGLLHDMGKLALDACLPKSYARVVSQTLSTGRCLCDVERELLGLDHTVSGKRLAVRWKLPRTITECVWLHHQPTAGLPESLASTQLLTIIHLADDLVRQQRIGFSGYNQIDPLEVTAKALALPPASLARVIAELPTELERNCRLVGVDDLNGATLYAKALAEANAELGRVNAALAETNRQLQMRSRCFDALSAFTGSLTLDDTIADICLAAARCLRSVTGLPAVVGFTCDADCGVYHLGVCAPDANRAEVFTVPQGLRAETAGGSARTAAITGPIGPAPAMAEPVARRCEEFLGLAPLRMLTISHVGLTLGGLLFSGEAEGDHLRSVSPREFEALGVAFGMAIADAADRARSDRLSEEMATAGRKLHQAQTELLRTRTLSMISEVAAGAAHELNNPLAVIAGRAQLLEDTLTEPEQRKAVKIIHDHARRASEIVSDLMQFAEPEPACPRDVALGSWLEALRDRWLERSSLRAGQLQVTLSDPRLSAFADPAQLQRILDAVLANAVEATSPDQAQVKINSASLSSDDRVVVTVEDNGVGMSPEVLQHAAHPFFSHRTAGRGRGMGLSHAVRLAAHNGGRLWIESTPGAGTTVHLELPAHRPSAA